MLYFFAKTILTYRRRFDIISAVDFLTCNKFVTISIWGNKNENYQEKRSRG